MSLKKLIFFDCLSTFTLGCRILYKNKTPQKIQIEIDSSTVVSYGTDIPVKIITHYSNRKIRNINNHPYLTTSAKSTDLSSKVLIPRSFPLNFNDSIVQLKAFFIKDKIQLSGGISLPFNYNDNLKLDFSGKIGNEGYIWSKK